MCTCTYVMYIHTYLHPFWKCQVTKLQTTMGVNHSPYSLKFALCLSLVLTQSSSSSSGFLADAPWVFYQDAEYLFYTYSGKWEDYEFVCGWLKSDILTIYSAQEQEFILSKIKVVPAHKSYKNLIVYTFFCPWGRRRF